MKTGFNHPIITSEWHKHASPQHRIANRHQPLLREWLAEAPFAMAMSSGFFSFFAHCGVLSVLEDHGFLPQQVSGSSAGALVIGAWAAGADSIKQRDHFLQLKREDFWDPGLGLGLLKGRRFRDKLSSMISVQTFEACRVPLVISAYDLIGQKTRILTSGSLIPAIHASCAVPILFQPVWIGGRPFLDGGIADRPGLKGMPNNIRLLYHHIASRSPWRRKNSPALRIPNRSQMVTLAIQDLPRVHPFNLEQGRKAFEHARKATSLLLNRCVKVPHFQSDFSKNCHNKRSRFEQ